MANNKEVIELTKSNSQLIYKPLPDNDPIRRQPDISLAKKYGWRPKYNLKNALIKAYESYLREI